MKTFLTLDSPVQSVLERSVVFFVKPTCDDVKRVASIINDLDTKEVSQNPLFLSLVYCFLLYAVLPLYYSYYKGNDDSEEYCRSSYRNGDKYGYFPIGR